MNTIRLLIEPLSVPLTNVAVASVAICLTLLAWAWYFRRASLPLQHTILMSATYLLLICPIGLLIAQKLNYGVLDQQHFHDANPLFAIRSESTELVNSAAIRADLPPGPAENFTASESAETLMSVGRQDEPVSSAPMGQAKTWEQRSMAIDQSTRRINGFATLLFLTWFVGAIISLRRLLRGLALISRLRQSLYSISRNRVGEALKSAAADVGFSGHVEFCHSKLAPVPMTIGIHNVAIVLPEDLENQLTDAQLQAVLIHELAHVIRRDNLLALLQAWVSAIFWWNPLLRLLNTKANIAREQICDDFVRKSMSQTIAFSEALVKVAEFCVYGRVIPATTTLLDDSQQLPVRLRRLNCLERDTNPQLTKRALNRWLIVVLSCIGFLVIPTIKSPVAGAQQPTMIASRTKIKRDTESSSNAATPSVLPLVTPVSAVTQDGKGIANQRLTEVTQPEQNAYIDSAMAFLLTQQKKNGGFTDDSSFQRYENGITSMVVTALIRAGAPEDSASIQQAILHVREADSRINYEKSLELMMWLELDRDSIRSRQVAKQLVACQEPNGLWGYDEKIRNSDHSNTAFVVRALAKAHQAGLTITPDVWVQVTRALVKSQNKDGGWGYKPNSPSTGNMTCSCLTSLALCAECNPALMPEFETSRREATRWLEDNFTVRTNPPGQPWHFTYLASLSEFMHIGGQTRIGKMEARKQIVHFLQQAQRADGSWKGRHHSNQIITTCFALQTFKNLELAATE